MGCGCNKGNTGAVKTKTAATVTGTLYEVLDTGGAIRLRTRDQTAAKNRADSNEGWRWRQAGQP